MPNLVNTGTRIYYQHEGTGDPLLLLHGLADSLWGVQALGYVEALKHHFRVLLVDARGHGYSAKPHDPGAYALNQLVGDILRVLDVLAIEQAHCLGYSLGGWIGLGMAASAPDRLLSLSVGGAHPYATDFGFYRIAFAQGIDAYIAGIEKRHGPLAQSIHRYLHNNDSLALQALVSYDRPAVWDDTFVPSTPTLFYAGTCDPLYPLIKQASQQGNGIQFYPLDGLDHYSVYMRPDLVIPLIMQHIKSGRVKS